jgi:uncharacterized Zn finger protein
MYWSYKPYVSVADRRANAQTQMDQLRKAGKIITPIEPFKGRKIASTFWGQAWCQHIECLSDFESRLARGKTYVRNGSVCHLEIKPGLVEAKVCGSEIYDIKVKIDPLPEKTWEAIKQKCRGQIGSVVELLQGKFSDSVMQILTDPAEGMFPEADDFGLDCDCPDFARLCKHLAAVLYGVGVRLDTQPELLFVLRGVDHFELIKEAATHVEPSGESSAATIAEADLSDVFGIDIDLSPPAAPAKSGRKAREKTGKVAKAAKRRPGKKSPAR